MLKLLLQHYVTDGQFALLLTR